MTVSTHVLDGMLGTPAAGVSVLLDRRDADGTWSRVAAGRTDASGRLHAGGAAPGVHRLTFGTGAYFAARGVAAFYPEVAITFEVTGADQHYHVPLLLSPFAYSTYRGS
ncbi:MAG: hydroxyisourate hydrolase [Streptosporangiaceae bacterium]|nr:hydroxyisourate hydrolase [Streptosporangiaceae bacterium]MBV9855851.1 hydroxyisourate hydrolase [Streptosporangiaceae bacterium]